MNDFHNRLLDRLPGAGAAQFKTEFTSFALPGKIFKKK
jgi:hypothetical protein